MTQVTTTATELARIMRCMGSRLMPRVIPADWGTEARDAGNAAHWLAERLFRGGIVPIGSKAYNGYVITDDMMEHVNTYLGALDCGDMEVETTFSGNPDPTTGFAAWEVRGRADHLKYDASTSTLTIDDFKYGWRLVSPVENWTLLAHAIGWSWRNGSPENYKQIDRVVLRIHQPRPYHSDGPVREWSCSYEQLCDYWKRIDHALSNPSDTLVSGLDQCAKCHARYNCPAFDRSLYNAIDVTVDSVFNDEMPNDVLAHEYETLDYAQNMIKTAIEAREELMTYRIKQGQVVHGYALQQRQGQRRWTPGLTGAALSAASGVDLRKDGIVTPAEAERRGVDKSVLAALTDRPLIGTKLSRIDADALARREFGEGPAQ